jgi:hypothetical protein
MMSQLPASNSHSPDEETEAPGGTDMSRLAPGARIKRLDLTAVSGAPVAVPDRDQLTHLQFRRYAGCPIYSLHLNAFMQRHAEIEKANISEVVVFHSPAEEIETNAADFPFALIADPGKRLYRQFGVEASPQALLHPRVWPFMMAGMARSVAKLIRREGAALPMFPEGGILGLPADFLIATGGAVLACKYGAYAYDQWSVEELITLSKSPA